jgi:hypothetical protein
MDAWQGVSGRFVIRGCALPRHAAITTWWQVCRPRTIGVFITKDPPCRPSTCGLREGGSKRRKRHELSPPACGKNEQPKNLKQKSSDDTPARGYILLHVVFQKRESSPPLNPPHVWKSPPKATFKNPAAATWFLKWFFYQPTDNTVPRSRPGAQRCLPSYSCRSGCHRPPGQLEEG